LPIEPEAKIVAVEEVEDALLLGFQNGTIQRVVIFNYLKLVLVKLRLQTLLL